MNKKLIGIAGGVAIVVSMFLPLISFLDISTSMVESNRGVATFFIICGLIVVGISLLSRRWLNLLSVLLGIIVTMLSLKYYGDAAVSSAGVEIGVWIMQLGGLLSVAGGIRGMFLTKQIT